MYFHFALRHTYTSSVFRHVKDVNYPAVDGSKNDLTLRNVPGDNDGKFSYSFYRPLITPDVDDTPITDDKLLYLMFAHGQANGMTMSYHGRNNKYISTEPFCLSCCK